MVRTPDQTRPITLLNTWYKLIDTLLEKRLRKFEREKQVIKEAQAGFMPGKSCAHQIFVLSTILDLVKKKNKPLVLTFIDIKKAFDSVNRELLLETLREKEVPEELITLTAKLYEGNKSTLTVQGKEIGEIEINRGVRQGSISSPLLFNFVMQKLTEELEAKMQGYTLRTRTTLARIRLLMYADDIVLVAETTKEMNQHL